MQESPPVPNGAAPSRRDPSTGDSAPDRLYDSSRYTCEDYDRTTSETFQASEAKFYGAYAEFRKKLDYLKYHVHYKKERQWLHDSIIEDILEGYSRDGDDGGLDLAPTTGAAVCRKPWLILTVGAQGAGKQYTVETLVDDGRLPLAAPVVVDMDEIRRRLPEYAWFLERVPERLDELTKTECGYISETLTYAALQQGKNVVLDSFLQDGEWYAEFIDFVRKEHDNHVKIGMIRVDAAIPVILERATAVAKDTGRDISRETIVRQLDALNRSIDIVKPVVDTYFEIQNDDEIILKGSSWPEFTSAFSSIDKDQSPAPLSDEPVCEISERRHRGRKHRRGSFLVFQSTEENYRTDKLEFRGPFASIRKTLDYNYHSNYTLERQGLQDRIIQYFLDLALVKDKNGEVCTTPTEPWIVFSAGAMGAGKSHTLKHLVRKERFPLISFVNVDPDAIRQFLPEFHVYLMMVKEKAGELTRKEAGYIAEILTLAALQKGKNVLVDGSLRDCDWYETYFARLREEFPALRIAILHVTAPKEAVIQRAEERALITGRSIPRQLLMDTMEQVPKSVKRLAPLVDYHAEIHNPPDVDDVELRTPGETWETFRSQWVQTCAWIPSKRVVEKISKKLSTVSSESSSHSPA